MDIIHSSNREVAERNNSSNIQVAGRTNPIVIDRYQGKTIIVTDR